MPFDKNRFASTQKVSHVPFNIFCFPLFCFPPGFSLVRWLLNLDVSGRDMRGTVRHDHLFVSLKIETLGENLTHRGHSGFCGRYTWCQRKGPRLRVMHFTASSTASHSYVLGHVTSQLLSWFSSSVGKGGLDWISGLQTCF